MGCWMKLDTHVAQIAPYYICTHRYHIYTHTCSNLSNYKFQLQLFHKLTLWTLTLLNITYSVQCKNTHNPLTYKFWGFNPSLTIMHRSILGQERVKLWRSFGLFLSQKTECQDQGLKGGKPADKPLFAGDYPISDHLGFFEMHSLSPWVYKQLSGVEAFHHR